MMAWFDYDAIAKILVFSVLIGAALPALFAVGVRLGSRSGAGGAAAPGRNPVLVALSWTVFALVLAVVIVGVLFVARDFIAHHTGWYLLGAIPR